MKPVTLALLGVAAVAGIVLYARSRQPVPGSSSSGDVGGTGGLLGGIANAFDFLADRDRETRLKAAADDNPFNDGQSVSKVEVVDAFLKGLIA